MQSRAMELLVGLFFLVGVAAVLLLTLRVASPDRVAGSDGYTITADFQNIGGLRAGSAVTLSGVRIGRVTAIHIDRNSFAARVSMRIQPQYNDLPTDSGASILTAGLLGEQYIGLDPGGAPESLTDGDHLRLTQDALVLEKLIGRFLSSMSEN